MALVSGSSPGCASMRMLKDYLLALDPPGDFLVRKARAQFIQFAFSKPSAFNCLSLEQGLISRGEGMASEGLQRRPHKLQGTVA